MKEILKFHETKLLHRLLLIIVFAILFLIMVCEIYFQIELPSQIKWILFIPTVYVIYSYIKVKRHVLALIILLMFLLSRDILEFVLLGQNISYIYTAESPGFEELYLYKNNRCKFTYGGILGVTNNFYGTFKLTGDTLLIKSKASILDLDGQNIEVNSKPVVIKQRI